MEISKGMVDYYLEKITVHWFDKNDLHAESLEDYYEKAIYIRDVAVENNDLEHLITGLDYLLCHNEISLEDHGFSYSWTNEEVREIVKYLVSIIYPNHKTDCNELKNYRLTNTTVHEWWKMQTDSLN
jgi:hypothetical protein